MDYETIRRKRDAVVESLKDQLEQTEPIGLPLPVSALILTPVLIAIAVWVGLKIALEVLVGVCLKPWKIFTLPFVGIWFWLDLVLISAWFLKRGAVKMSEDR